MAIVNEQLKRKLGKIKVQPAVEQAPAAVELAAKIEQMQKLLELSQQLQQTILSMKQDLMEIGVVLIKLAELKLRVFEDLKGKKKREA
jgi:hypothetical protein